MIFRLIYRIVIYEIALKWMTQNLTNKSTLAQLMAWCLQATSHYLSQCWPRSMSTYGIIRPQWVNKVVAFVETAPLPHTLECIPSDDYHTHLYGSHMWWTITRNFLPFSPTQWLASCSQMYKQCGIDGTCNACIHGLVSSVITGGIEIKIFNL